MRNTPFPTTNDETREVYNYSGEKPTVSDWSILGAGALSSAEAIPLGISRLVNTQVGSQTLASLFTTSGAFLPPPSYSSGNRACP